MATRPPVNRVTVNQRLKWQQLGYAMHFASSRYCRFHLATMLENKIIVSTVGHWEPKNANCEMEPLGGGDDGFFETYVFKAGHKKEGRPSIGDMLDGKRCNTSEEAQALHIEMCEQFQMRLNSGEFR